MRVTLSVLAMLAAVAVLPAARAAFPATEDDDADVEPGAYVVSVNIAIENIINTISCAQYTKKLYIIFI